MSIFSSIMSKIFGHNSTPAAAKADDTSTTTQTSSSGQAASASPTSAGPPNASVDVSAVLTDLASKNPQKLDWRHSIVDLMKLLNLDSSLTARQELARELHYSGDTNDSAAMNMWLHRQVMAKLAENGGRVPDELRH